MQIKLFSSNNSYLSSIEKDMNKWLNENPTVTIKDIKIAKAGNGGTTFETTYMIIYDEKQEERL